MRISYKRWGFEPFRGAFQYEILLTTRLGEKENKGTRKNRVFKKEKTLPTTYVFFLPCKISWINRSSFSVFLQFRISSELFNKNCPDPEFSTVCLFSYTCIISPRAKIILKSSWYHPSWAHTHVNSQSNPWLLACSKFVPRRPTLLGQLTMESKALWTLKTIGTRYHKDVTIIVSQHGVQQCKEGTPS